MGRGKTRGTISTPCFPSRPKFYREREVWVQGWVRRFWFKVATLDFSVAGTSQSLALTTLPIQRYRKYKKSPQLHPKKDICYLQYRLRAVINSSNLLRGVPLPSRAFSHVRGHLRLLRFSLYGPMLAVYMQ